MRAISIFSLLILLLPFNTLSQSNQLLFQDSTLKGKIYLLFQDLEKIDSIYFSQDVKAEFVQMFENVFDSVKIDFLFFKPIIENHVRSIYHQSYEKENDVGKGAIPFSEFALINNQQMNYYEGVLDKYAFIVLNRETLNSSIEIYLNGEFECFLSEASRIRVFSQKPYQIDLVLNSETICSKTLKLKKRENYVLRCRK